MYPHNDYDAAAAAADDVDYDVDDDVDDDVDGLVDDDVDDYVDDDVDGVDGVDDDDDYDGVDGVNDDDDDGQVPRTVDALQGVLTVIPLQLLSYHLAVLRSPSPSSILIINIIITIIMSMSCKLFASLLPS